MADCHACAEAAASPTTCGSYNAACWQCSARMLAHSPAAREAVLGYPGDLQAAMVRIWPTAEAYRRGRVEVHRWVKLIERGR